MLERLRIQGFTLLDDVSIELTPGLNVLSGETGAGKSLVLTALGLLLGARTPASCVREGHDSALVEANFAATSGPLRLSRSIRKVGRGICFVGDEAVPLSRLAEVGKSLLCFAFQHSQIEIGSPAIFLAGLDVLAGNAALGREYGAAYADLSLARVELSRVRSELAGRDARQRLVREQVALLEKLGPRPGEHGRLAEKLRILRRAQTYLELAARIEHALAERDSSISEELSGLIRQASRVADDASQARALCDALSRAAFEVEEALRAAERLRADLDVEAQDIDALEARFAELDRLALALGISGDALCERLESLRQELTLLEGAEERASFAEAEVEAATERALALAERLHQGRSAHATELTRRIEVELSALCLLGARVELGLGQAKPSELGPLGLTQLEARFAANPGEPFGPLAEVASGGERSRLLVALRCAGLETGAETLVFDEIDAGVGGAAAEAVAARLRRAAESRQIICITHQACVAARAAGHFRVHKVQSGGRTRTEVEALGQASRVDELMRMLSGSRSENARRLALDLVNAARAERKRPAA
ncbi:MAG TPA: AAA family ATPase [Polyangiaceae bacterium]|nr:AAA family ATPase [Polyangiaceae bacterium]